MGGANEPRVYARNKLMQLEESIADRHPTIAQSMLRIALQEVLLLLTPIAPAVKTGYDPHLVLFLRVLGAAVDFDYALDAADRENAPASTELLCWYLVVVQGMVLQLHSSADTSEKLARYHAAFVINELLHDRVRATVRSIWAQDNFAELHRNGG